MREVLLQMNNIQKTFPGVKALSSAQLLIHRGEVHALIGENGAGKSTLMKVLLGIYQADAGEIFFDGRQVSFNAPTEALHAGIAMIQQEICLMPNVDVSENIWAGREDKFRKGLFLDVKARYRATEELLDKYGINLDPRRSVKALSIAQMQLTELARAISYDAKLIIMDEPTSALTNSEIETLYRIVNLLSSQGVSIIFISHKLEEIFRICENVTVMRDGQYIATRAVKDLQMQELIRLIVGRELNDFYPKRTHNLGGTMVEVKGLNNDHVSNVSFQARKGEILGFCGLIGAGRTEIMRAIFGADKCKVESIVIDGQAVRIRSPKDAIRVGIGMLTEDRLRLGSITKLSTRYNLTAASLNDYTRFGVIDKSKETNACQEIVERLAIKVPSIQQVLALLSGGNQQKVIFGRWILCKPKVLILDEPTRGIDVGSKRDIYEIINHLAEQGMTILLVSSELPELMGVSDRILVVRNGSIVGEFQADDATQEELMNTAFGAR